MSAPEGLRERRKARLRAGIAATAIRMFLARGFDAVSITDVARAAEVSRRTLFSYFPTKEDLVLQRFADHQDEPARIVRGRAAGQSPLDALRAAWLDALGRRDPNTGLNDDAEIVAFLALVTGTPSLAARLTNYTARSVDALAQALGEAGLEPLTARLAAAQVVAVQHELTRANHTRIAAGETAAVAHPDAVRAADLAFALLRGGLERPLT